MTVPPGNGGGGSRLPDLGSRGEGWVVGQFVLLAVVALASLPCPATMAAQTPIRWVLLLIGCAELLIGGWAIARAFADLGRSLTPLPRPHADAGMVEGGIYRRIRHPSYAGLLLAAIGWAPGRAGPGGRAGPAHFR